MGVFDTTVIDDFEFFGGDFNFVFFTDAEIDKFKLGLTFALPVAGAQGVGQVKLPLGNSSAPPPHHNTDC